MQTCPMCGEWVANDASACAHCGETLEATETGSPELRRVRTGLLFVLAGLALNLLAMFVLVFWTVPLERAIQPGSAVLYVIAGLAITGSAAHLVGKLLCLTVPRSVGATRLICSSLGFDALSFLLQLTPGADLARQTAVVLAALAALAGLVGYVLFVIFLRRLSTYIGDTDLVRTSEGVLAAGAVGLVVYLAGLAIGHFAGPGIGGLIVLAAMGVLIVALVRYVRVLRGLRRAI